MIFHQEASSNEKATSSDAQAVVVGLTAPAGAGKSTVAQLIAKVLYVLHGIDRIEVIGLDDFLSASVTDADTDIVLFLYLHLQSFQFSPCAYFYSLAYTRPCTHVGAVPGGKARTRYQMQVGYSRHK